MAAHQASPSLEFSRQEHWSGLPFPSPMHESEKWKWSRSVVSILSDSMDCSHPGSSIHGIFQAGVLEWVPLPSLKLTWVHIKSVNPKGNQSWIFTGRTNVEAEALILWPPDANNWLLRKNCNAGKDWRREEKVTTQDEIVGWHHWLKDVSLSRLQEMVMDRIAGHAAVHGVT